MRILFLIDSLRPGGKERRLVELLKGLSKYKEIKCELVIMSDEIHYTAIHNLDVKIHYVIRKWKKDPGIFLKLYKLCKKVRPDIIHSWGSMPSVYALPIAKTLKIKFINAMISDAPYKLSLKALIRSKLTFPFSDVILSNSNAGLKPYKAPSNKSVCIHNGFDFERISKIENKKTIKAKFGIKTEKVVGMIASFSGKKDYNTYILAAQKILTKRNDIIFLAIGNGVNLKKCKKIVKPEFQNKIKFLGKQRNVESIVSVFDVGVLSTYTEGISNVIMEYMALGKPVIATKGGGTNEILMDREAGFLVEPESVERLASKIEYLLENEKIASNMGEKGRETIKKEFSLEKMTNSYVSLYKRLLNQRV